MAKFLFCVFVDRDGVEVHICICTVFIVLYLLYMYLLLVWNEKKWTVQFLILKFLLSIVIIIIVNWYIDLVTKLIGNYFVVQYTCWNNYIKFIIYMWSAWNTSAELMGIMPSDYQPKDVSDFLYMCLNRKYSHVVIIE